MNNKGQSILAEYVMIFFVVIAGLGVITTYVQRSFEARIHDARNFMVDSVVNSGACGPGCLQATGGSIAHEYEPYYTQMFTTATQSQSENSGITPGNAQVIRAIYSKSTNESTATTSGGIQLPAQCANGGC